MQLTNLKCKCQIFKLSFYCFTAFLLLAHNQNRKHTTMHKMQNAQKYTINKGRYETHLQLFKLASNQLQFGKCSTCVNFWQVSCNCTKNENIVFSQLDSFSQTENFCLDKVQNSTKWTKTYPDIPSSGRTDEERNGDKKKCMCVCLNIINVRKMCALNEAQCKQALEKKKTTNKNIFVCFPLNLLRSSCLCVCDYIEWERSYA